MTLLKAGETMNHGIAADAGLGAANVLSRYEGCGWISGLHAKQCRRL